LVFIIPIGDGLNILEYTIDELVELFRSRYKKGRYHAEAVYREAFRNGALELSGVKEFESSPALSAEIENDFSIDLWPVVDTVDDGGVTKFVTRSDDGYEYETVVIPMKNYNTLCVSTQVGCKMGCTFCETGKLGLLRNLSAAEIVGQVFYAKHVLGANIRNIVYMGMGEPLDNFDNVVKSINILCEDKGINFNHGNITISTVGDVDGIRKLGQLNWPNLKLAISLHSADDAKRSEIMPVNRKYSLSDLKRSLLEYPLKDAGIFFIEYILIKDFNDSRADADALVEFLKGLRVKVNLIPYNPGSEDDYRAPSVEGVDRFYQWLDEAGLVVIKRVPKGQDLMAACGQLGNKELYSQSSL